MDNKTSPSYYSAVVVINPMGEVLLGKRKEDGIWTTPAGSSEPGEMDPAKTACRELFEEAGIPADFRFLQKVKSVDTANGKVCHVYLYVAPTGIMTSSKLDPDQEVKKWGWYSIDQIPKDLQNDKRRFDSVREAYMKFHNINKSELAESLEKGGKPAQTGEVRTFAGKQYQKMGDGSWVPYKHKEEKQIEAIEAKEAKDKKPNPKDKLAEKLAEKKSVSIAEQHLADLKNGAIVTDKKLRNEKPIFTTVDQAIANGYTVEEFREAGNFFYDRAEKLQVIVDRYQDSGVKVEPAFKQIISENAKIGKQFFSQANVIEGRQDKAKLAVKKSTVMMGYADGAEINTQAFAVEHEKAQETGLLDRFQLAMADYNYGDLPVVIALDAGDLHIVKVEEGLYSGVFKQRTLVPEGELMDTAKVRIERMTLPSLVMFCIAKNWTMAKPAPIEAMPEPVNAIYAPEPILEMPVNPVDRKLEMLRLLDKLLS